MGDLGNSHRRTEARGRRGTRDSLRVREGAVRMREVCTVVVETNCTGSAITARKLVLRNANLVYGVRMLLYMEDLIDIHLDNRAHLSVELWVVFNLHIRVGKKVRNVNVNHPDWWAGCGVYGSVDRSSICVR